MSGTHHYFTETGRPLPPPPLHPPSRSSTILELPTYRYDPSRSKENVKRHSLETPQGGEFCILPESDRRSSQVVVYNGSASNSQNDLQSNKNKNKSSGMNGNEFDSHSHQHRDHRPRRSKSGKQDGSGRHQTKKKPQDNEVNENNSEGKETKDLSLKEKTAHERPSSLSSPSSSSRHHHRHHNRHRHGKSSAPRSSQEQSISQTENENNSISVSKDDNSKKESEDGIPHRGRGPASVPRTSSSHSINKKKLHKQHHHHQNEPEKLEYEEWLQTQKKTPTTSLVESEMSKQKYNHSNFDSAPINSHVYAARRSRERAEHVARHPHLPISAITDPYPITNNETYNNPEYEEYYIHKAHNGVNDDNEAMINGHAMQTINTTTPPPSQHHQHTDGPFQFITPQEIDKEENDLSDTNKVSNKEKIAKDGVPELYRNNLNNNNNNNDNNKPQSRSEKKNKHGSSAKDGNLQNIERQKHHRRKLRSASSSSSLSSSSSSSSLHFSSSSSSFSSTELQTHHNNNAPEMKKSETNKTIKKEENTPFTSQQVLGRSPSEAAARFRAAHTSGPTSIPLHVLQQRRNSNSNVNKGIINEKDVLDNDYYTPHKENENENENGFPALHSADGTRPVRRGSLEKNETMISLNTPKHKLSKSSETTGTRDNNKIEKKVNDTQPTLTLPAQSSLVPNRANRRYNGYREKTHTPVSNKDDEINTVNLKTESIHNNKLTSTHEPFYTSPTSILHKVTEGVDVQTNYTPFQPIENETINKRKEKDSNKTHEIQPKQSERFRFRQPTPPESTYQPLISRSRMSLSSRPASRASYESGTISPNNRNNNHPHHSGNSVARSFRRSMSEHIPLSARVRARSHSRSESEMRSAHEPDQTESSNHHYNSAVWTIGGTELLPSRPVLQGMRSSKDNRALFTIHKFIERQPPSTRGELEDMLIEYEGREEELCEVLAEIYGEDFEAQRQMLLMEGSMNEPVQS